MELWDLYDIQRQSMSELQMRGKPIPGGCYRVVVFIWTLTYDDRPPLTKWDACKPDGLPWEVTGDFVLHGETLQEGAKRELYEETGISCRVEQLQKPYTKVKRQRTHDHYPSQYPVELDKPQPQEKETIDVMLVDQSTFEDMMRVHILTHPLQLWCHEPKGTLVAYFQESRQRQI